MALLPAAGLRRYGRDWNPASVSPARREPATDAFRRTGAHADAPPDRAAARPRQDLAQEPPERPWTAWLTIRMEV